MKAELAKLIQDYKDSSESYVKRLKETLRKFSSPEMKERYTEKGLSEAIDEARAEIMDEWNKVNEIFNQKAKMIISDAEEGIAAKIMGSVQKPSDYAIRVNNAMQFLGMETKETLTDDAAFAILKDFTSDYEQMKLFKRVLENKGIAVDTVYGNNDYPKTFGKLAQAEAALASFADVKEMAENIFIHKKYDSDDTVYVFNKMYSMPMDGYTEIANWDSILELADALDKATPEN